jgi:hypothetical protein
MRHGRCRGWPRAKLRLRGARPVDGCATRLSEASSAWTAGAPQRQELRRPVGEGALPGGAHPRASGSRSPAGPRAPSPGATRCRRWTKSAASFAVWCGPENSASPDEDVVVGSAGVGASWRKASSASAAGWISGGRGAPPAAVDSSRSKFGRRADRVERRPRGVVARLSRQVHRQAAALAGRSRPQSRPRSTDTSPRARRGRVDRVHIVLWPSLSSSMPAASVASPGRCAGFALGRRPGRTTSSGRERHLFLGGTRATSTSKPFGRTLAEEGRKGHLNAQRRSARQAVVRIGTGGSETAISALIGGSPPPERP